MSLLHTESRHSIKVPKKSVQQVLRQLVLSEILDRDFHFVTDDNTIILPLLRKLNSSEIGRVSRIDPRVEFAEERFQRLSRHPRNLEQVLSNRVPEDVIREIPRSLDVVGDIAIFESSRKTASYEKIIADGIMRVQPSVRAVFSKAGKVSGEARVRPLRNLAGEDRTATIHREFGCRFKVDLSKVFFSPRLSTEHRKIAGQVKEGESVVDMFGGVGPFSILIAKKVQDVEVNTIDSNEHAARLIRENARLNKVSEKVHVYMGDAREVVNEKLRRKATRVIMNHPSRSHEFIDAACSALISSGGVIHYYRFADGEDWEEKINTEFENGLLSSGFRAEEILASRQVREVGPRKWQAVIDARVVEARSRRSQL